MRRFGPGGEFATWDGLQFDVLWFNNHYHPELRRRSDRGMDADADGQPDGGQIGALNVYSIGVTEFRRTCGRGLRGARFSTRTACLRTTSARSESSTDGERRLSRPPRLRRARSVGGSEPPVLLGANARPPVFNYINHKYIEPGKPDNAKFQPPVPSGIHSLSFAAAVFTDAAICYAYEPPAEAGEIVGVWDELWQGRGHKVGWLGMHVGPAVHLAARQPGILDHAVSRRWSGLQVTNPDPGAAETRVPLKGIDAVDPERSGLPAPTRSLTRT